MKALDSADVSKARKYLEKSCRRLEQQLFIHWIEKENRASVLHALRQFQNPDGGFGRGLEPDFWLPASSPMATSLALGIMTEMEIADDEPMVRDSIAYLLRTCNQERCRWQSVPEEVNEHPHAPWWHFSEEHGAASPDGNWGNPSAELIGYLIRYRRLVPADLVDRLRAFALNYIDAHPEEMEMHEVSCLVRFAQHITAQEFALIRDKLSRLVTQAITVDPAGWRSYSAQPLDFIKSPGSFLFPQFEAAVQANLDFWLDTKTDDGVWHPAWKWVDYAQEWQQAEQMIIGMLTVERLKLLKRFGRFQP